MNRYFFALLIVLSSSTYAADYLMTADEVSNTLSFVSPEGMQSIGYMQLGPSKRFALASSVKSKSQNNVHGLAFSPDGKTMAVTSNISNSVALYDTGNLSKFKDYVNVGLSPHVAMFTPDSSELWVATRGTSNVEIINVKTGKIKKIVQTEACPSFFAFDAKQTLVYISYTCSTKLDVYNYKTKKKVKTATLNGTFSPLIALSPDQKELWVIRKDSGEVARISTDKMDVIEYLPVGLYPQHVIFGEVGGKVVGLVTNGGDNDLKVFSFTSGTKTPAVLDFSVKIPHFPHGLATSPDKKIAYVATEHGDRVYSISLSERKVLASAQVGNSPQSLVYVKNLDLKDFRSYMRRMGDSQVETKSFNFVPFAGKTENRASVSVRSYSSDFDFDFDFKVQGKFKDNEEYRFYLSGSSKSVDKIPREDRMLVGVVVCSSQFAFVCMSSSILPPNDLLKKFLSTPSTKFFATDKDDEVIFINDESLL